MIEIREASSGDAVALSEVLCSSIRELCSADHHDDPETISRWTANKTPEHLAGWIDDPQLSIILAQRNREPAGVGCVTRDGEVLLNYVAPAHRFCGVSRAVLVHLESRLAAEGTDRARLVSTETARRFYRGQGWVEVGEPAERFGLTGYPMEKDLARLRGE